MRFDAFHPKTQHLLDVDLLTAILCERPDLRGKPVSEPPAQGMHGNVLFIGNEVFKGASHEIHVNGMDKEIETLQVLGKTSLPVPRLTCVGKNTAFFGMTKLPGEPLKKHVDKLALRHWQGLGKALSNFVFGFARAFPAKWCADRKETLYACHGDISLNNTLVDPVTLRLSGIVDLGIVSYRTPHGALKVNTLAIHARLTEIAKPFFNRRIEKFPLPVAAPEMKP